MSPFILYIIKAATVYLLCYLLYWVLFRKETFFRRNRVYLLISLVLPALIPLIQLPGNQLIPETVDNVAATVRLAIVDFIGDDAATTISQNPVIPGIGIPEDQGGFAHGFSQTLPTLILIVYLSGVLFFLMRMFRSYGQIMGLILHAQKKKLMKMILVITRNKVSPFSIFKWLVIPEHQEKHPDIDKIIRHEMIHHREKHSIDILLAELLIAFQWFNPIAWMLKSAVIKNNEFIVDQQLLTDQIDPKDYQYALLTASVGKRKLAMVNGFNRGLIKKRIEMMNKKETPVMNRLKNMLILPFATVILIAFSAYTHQAPETVSEPAPESAPVPQDKKVKHDTLKKNIRIYVDGKMLDLKNVTDPDGDVSDLKIISLKDKASINAEFGGENIAEIIDKFEDNDENAVLMIKRTGQDKDKLDMYVGVLSSDQAKDNDRGVIYLENLDENIVIYTTKGKVKTLMTSEKDGKSANIFISTDKHSAEGMVFVIDGKVVEPEKVQELDSKGIYSITILDAEDAKKEYGEKAKNGAIEIQTKKTE